MPKTYTAPQPFSTQPYRHIPMDPVESSQVRAIGYDAETKTLAVTFAHGVGSIYHYQNVEPQTHADFLGAESIGKYFGKHIQPLAFDKFPAPVAA